MAEFGGKRREREMWMGSGASGHDGERERQPAAAADQLCHGLRLGSNPAGAEASGQQGGGLGRAERVQRERVGTLLRHKADQPVAAGDHNQATRASGQQRAHLSDVTGVVQHDEYLAFRQYAPIQRGAAFERGGDPFPGDAKGFQEGVQRVDRPHRRAAWVEASHVEVELSAGELAGNVVSPMQSQRRLPDARGSVDG